MNRLSHSVALAAVVALVGGPLVAAPAQAADDVTINLVGINDFHGRIDSATVQWAGTVKQLEADAPAGQSLLVSAGDNVSASLFASAIQDDNPTIDLLNEVGLDASATGNHEFDKGYDDLVNRIIPRADFPILGANVKKSDGSDALDPSAIFTIAGVKVAVVGAVTQETPTLVSPAGVQGLSFGDPVAGINTEVTRLNALPEADRPQVIVASFHEGAPDGTLSLPDAVAGSAVFRHLVEDTSADVDAIFMGHTHQKYAYSAPVPGDAGKTRPIIQTGNYGENVGQIKLQVNPDTGDVTSFTLRNEARSTATDAALIGTYPDLAKVKTLRDDAVAYAARVGNVKKGEITADITRAFTGGVEDRGGESTAGGLVANALLAQVSQEPAGADIGVVNPGGLRSPDLTFKGVAGDPVNTDGVVTFAELNSVLPFANNVNSVAMSGATFKKILEQQWQRDAAGNVPSRAYLQLGLSKNVSYTFDPSLPEGSRITSVTVNGEPLDAARTYKVATFSFLATGGDNFRAFKEGVSTDTGLVDRDTFVSYFGANSPVSPDFARRSVQSSGLQSSYDESASVSFTLDKLDMTSLGSPANSSVAVSLVQGDTETDLGDFPVSGGAASPTVTLPDGVSGSARLKVTATPSGTSALLPAFDIVKAAPELAPSKIQAATLPLILQGTSTVVGAVVSGGSGRPTGSVTVAEGEQKLGTGRLSRGAAVVVADTRRLAPGQHRLTVSYPGNDTYEPSSTTVSVLVFKLFGWGR